MLDRNDNFIPVTLLHVPNSFVSQIKTFKSDGYQAVQLVSVPCNEHKINNPQLSHIKKAKLASTAYKHMYEARMDDISDIVVGQAFSLKSICKKDRYIDVQGISKGKGFAGTIKRWGFAIQNATHGNSKSHRKPGSTGTCTMVGRVFKNKKMPGHMGNVKSTVQNLKVLFIDTEKQLIAVRGAVPGSKNSKLMISPAIKKKIAK
jgi:large subunit ribosomal protein L3